MAAQPLIPFLPAVYEHKAWFIGRTPSEAAQDADLLTQAALAEHAALEPDALTIGLDVYNIEAEACGIEVVYPKDTGVPAVKQTAPRIQSAQDVADLHVPDPAKDGRMPLFVETVRRVRAELGPELWLRGAVSGPFSLAAQLLGHEQAFLAPMLDPDLLTRTLDFAEQVVRAYGLAFIEAGAGVVLFDSLASPDLLPPQAYAEHVQPATARLIAAFQQAGCRRVPLIIGGDTTPIIDALIATGSDNLLCDFSANWTVWQAKCAAAGRAVRRNLSAGLIQAGPPEAIETAAREAIAAATGFSGFILGTAVVPYATPTEHLLAVRRACRE